MERTPRNCGTRSIVRHVNSAGWFDFSPGGAPPRVGRQRERSEHRATLDTRSIRNPKAGKAVAGDTSHRLPVVAMGSIPHIYRREGRSPRDPN